MTDDALTENMETRQELRRRLLVDEDFSDPDTLASAAEAALMRERQRAGGWRRDLREEDLPRLIKLAHEEEEKLAAIMTRKVAVGGVAGMF